MNYFTHSQIEFECTRYKLTHKICLTYFRWSSFGISQNDIYYSHYTYILIILKSKIEVHEFSLIKKSLKTLIYKGAMTLWPKFREISNDPLVLFASVRTAVKLFEQTHQCVFFNAPRTPLQNSIFLNPHRKQIY